MVLAERGSSVLVQETCLDQLLKRPEINYSDIVKIVPPPVSITGSEALQVEIQIKYEGYIKRQLQQVERFTSLEQKKIPDNMDYDNLKGLGTEVRQKLKLIRPASLGQASRISGVTPAAMSLIMVALEKRKREKSL
jgi:tRNA uridine 5-carboxymethylaminomethyl modification enzyme